MIIFLYGQDTYRSHQKLNEIVDHYKKTHKSGLNLRHFDFKKDDYESFQDEIRSVSMFAGKKLIIFKNAFLDENFKTNFIKNAKKFLNSEDTILFYEEEVSEKDKLFKFLKANGKFQEFKLLGKEGLKNWTKKELENRQAKIAPEALEKLIEFVGNDLWQLSNEIQKLANYKWEQRIEIKDVSLLVQPKIETDIFKTIDAIAARSKRNALSLIHQHLEKGDSPLYLLSMINFQFRNILLMKSLKYYTPAIPKKLGIHPYVARKSMEQSSKFSLEELNRIYRRIFQLDLAIKTGKIEPQTALELLIAEI